MDGKFFGGVVVATEGKKRTTMSILRLTKDALDSSKHPGQTYDGVIQELVKFWSEKKSQRKERKTHVPVG